MSEKRIAIIERCSMCSASHYSQSEGWVCLAAKRTFDIDPAEVQGPPSQIPDWCPLTKAAEVIRIKTPPSVPAPNKENSIAVRLMKGGGRASYPEDMVALVSPQDAGLLSGYNWYARREKHGAYVIGKPHGKRCFIPLHRLILGAEKGVLVDHVNGNGLDNRRENLRVCSSAQNARNMRARKHSSPFKGVQKRGENKWTCQIHIGAKRETIGTFDSEEKAAIAYDLRALYYFGDFARLNKPELSIGLYRAALFGEGGPLEPLA